MLSSISHGDEALWLALYNFLFLPVWIGLSLARPMLRKGFRDRMGLVEEQGPDTVRWIHCASVGELSAVSGLVYEMREKEPDSRVVISTITRTGKRRSEELFPGVYTFIAPIDFCLFVRSALAKIGPQILFVVETELWPNLLSMASQRGVTVVVVNGRLSHRSLRRYLLLRTFFGEILRCVDWFFVQTDADRAAFQRLGVPRDRVSVTGTMKSDLSVAPADGKSVLSSLAIPEKARILVAGSVRREEEDDLLRAFAAVLKSQSSAYFIVAPRHIQRARSIGRRAEKMGFRVRFRSDGGRYAGESILILDTLGELTKVYGAAHVSFVGGSLRPYGGHNVLEPAMWGVPVLFGKFTKNCNEEADELVSLKGGMRVNGWGDLATKILLLLRDEELRARMGRNARSVVETRSGVSAMVYETLRLKGLLGKK
jgi:3-deoxy-D-manno-octulosonic-acid transferase